jgi:hypothetical protein
MDDVLRPELYRRLERLFGDPRVAHAGEPIEWGLRQTAAGRWTRYIDSQGLGHARGETYVVNCPFCGDHRRRLYVNHMWGLPDPVTGSLNLWLAKCYNETNCLDVVGHPAALYDQVFWDGAPPTDLVRPAGAFGASRPVGPRWRWPGRVVPLHELPDGHPARAYVAARRYDPDWLGRHLGVGALERADWPDYEWLVGRLVIPVFDAGACVGWQARALWPHKVKYYTADGMNRGGCLYNVDSARRFGHAVVVEGVTKVWRYGPEAVATFGNAVTGNQLARLTAWPVVVVMLDPNAAESSAKTVRSLSTVRRVLEVRPPCDPGDLPDGGRALVLAEAARQGVELPVTPSEMPWTPPATC